jgi:hypothetical protein
MKKGEEVMKMSSDHIARNGGGVKEVGKQTVHKRQ